MSDLSENHSGYRRFENFYERGCLAAFSCQRLDLGFHNNLKVKENRRDFLNRLDIPAEGLVCLQQVHGNKVFLASRKDRGKGAFDYNKAIGGYDGMITNEKRLPLAVFSADCLSVFMLDPRNRAAALLHAGWRGTKEEISLAALKRMKEEYGSQPEDILCAFGPGIRSCCYEVGQEFEGYFSRGLIKRQDKLFLDLISLNLEQLTGSGLAKDNIIDSGICTSCRRDDFFSYRRDGDGAGRMMSVIMIR